MDDRFDNLFATVASNANGIEPLLDVFFGFLLRRTDFFVSPNQTSQHVEKVVLDACRKHQALAEPRRQQIAAEHKAKDAAAAKLRAAKQHQQSQQQQQQQHTPHVPPPVTENPRVEEIFDDASGDQPAPIAIDLDEVDDVDVVKDDVDVVNNDNDNDDEDSGGFDPSKHGNGGATDRYTWTQTLKSVEVMIDVPDGTRGSSCSVNITPTMLKISVKRPNADPLVIEGNFHQKVKPDDSCWTLEENKTIVLSLEKSDNMRWWACVLDGDNTIDTKKIVPENSKLSDLDGETRATVEKMFFDQRQKELGKPTSDKLKQAEMLEKFKKAHPEMDFSKAKINYGGNSGGMMFDN